MSAATSTRRAAVLLALLAASAAQAAPLATANPGALARGFALPALGLTAPPPEGEAAWRLSVDLSSEYVAEESDTETLLLDGESTRLALSYGGALGRSADWSVEIPLLHTGGGFMDSVIENWHDTFNLPNGGREDAPQDRYAYRYTRNGLTRLAVEHGGTRLADVLLNAGWEARPGLMLRGQLKLPTGDDERLAGGNAGAALWTDLALPFEPGSGFEGQVSAGLSAPQESGVLGELQRTVIPFGGLGLGVQATPALQLLAQVYLHAPLYRHTDIDALQRPGAPLTLGLRYCGARQCVELAFQEDLSVGASPDFSLRLALSSR